VIGELGTNIKVIVRRKGRQDRHSWERFLPPGRCFVRLTVTISKRGVVFMSVSTACVLSKHIRSASNDGLRVFGCRRTLSMLTRFSI
jgi:hypothetical protein